MTKHSYYIPALDLYVGEEEFRDILFSEWMKVCPNFDPKNNDVHLHDGVSRVDINGHVEYYLVLGCHSEDKPKGWSPVTKFHV